MKQLRNYINIRKKQSTIIAFDDNLEETIIKQIKSFGPEADLNNIDVSRVTDMNSLFSQDQEDWASEYHGLNPDISKWNVSSVTNMDYMFYKCTDFNCDISSWDVSNVTSMNSIFAFTDKFNQDLSSWDVRNVKYYTSAFFNSSLNTAYEPKFKSYFKK